LFRCAVKRGLVFADPTTRLTSPDVDRSRVPMTEAEIHAVEQLLVTPAQRLVVALAAVHAARPDTILRLTLDDLELPNRRITLAGHQQPIADLVHQALRAWLEQRRDTWPRTPNRHVLISAKSALGRAPVGRTYITERLLPRSVELDRIRGDRVLQEALTVGPDPLHLALVFNLAHTTAARYAAVAEKLLDTPPESDPEPWTSSSSDPDPRNPRPVQARPPKGRGFALNRSQFS